jgi:hypothetical protein
MTKKYLATITILSNDRQANSAEIQKILTANGHIIMARMGVNVQKSCISNCTALITISIEASKKEIDGLTKQLDRIYGVVAKSNIMIK